jgi:hypothetical protein
VLSPKPVTRRAVVVAWGAAFFATRRFARASGCSRRARARRGAADRLVFPAAQARTLLARCARQARSTLWGDPSSRLTKRCFFSPMRLECSFLSSSARRPRPPLSRGSPSAASGTPSIVAISMGLPVSFSICVQALFVAGPTKVNDAPCLASAPGAADAVNVIVRAARRLVIEDVADIRNVEAARGDVRRNEILQVAWCGSDRASWCAMIDPDRRGLARR